MTEKNFVKLLIGILIILIAFLILKIFSPTISFSSEQNFYVTRILPDYYAKNIPFNVSLEIIMEENFSLQDFKFFLSDVADGSRIIPLFNYPNMSVSEDIIFWRELSPGIYSLIYSVVSSEDEVNFNGRWEFNLENYSNGIYSNFVVGDSEIFAYQDSGNTNTENAGGGGGGFGTQKNISNYYVLDEKNIYADSEKEERNIFQEKIFSQEQSSLDSNPWLVFVLIILIVVILIVIIFIRMRKK